MMTYSQILRALGQALELEHLQGFNLESNGNSYFISGWRQALKEKEAQENDVKRSHWWMPRRGRSQSQIPELVLYAPVPVLLQYTLEDLIQFERQGQAKRRDVNKMPNGHGMSQLLRAVGGYLGRKGGHLLALSWKEESVGIVYMTPEGRREFDEFRLDSVYDIWVKMFLRRDQSAKQDND
jgi:hypothetical protein